MIVLSFSIGEKFIVTVFANLPDHRAGNLPTASIRSRIWPDRPRLYSACSLWGAYSLRTRRASPSVSEMRKLLVSVCRIVPASVHGFPESTGTTRHPSIPDRPLEADLDHIGTLVENVVLFAWVVREVEEARSSPAVAHVPLRPTLDSSSQVRGFRRRIPSGVATVEYVVGDQFEVPGADGPRVCHGINVVKETDDGNGNVPSNVIASVRKLDQVERHWSSHGRSDS